MGSRSRKLSKKLWFNKGGSSDENDASPQAGPKNVLAGRIRLYSPLRPDHGQSIRMVINGPGFIQEGQEEGCTPASLGTWKKSNFVRRFALNVATQL